MKILLLAGFFFVGSPAQSPDVALRNGSGINPRCLASQSAPGIGSTWRVEVDTSGHPGAAWTLVEGRALPSAGPTLAIGELLIDRRSVLLFTSIRSPSGGLAVHDIAIPESRLAGLTFSVQAVIGPPGQDW